MEDSDLTPSLPLNRQVVPQPVQSSCPAFGPPEPVVPLPPPSWWLFFPGGLLGAGRLRLCSVCPLLRPPTPYSILNCFSASRTEFSFGLRCYRRGWRCRVRTRE